MRNRIEKIIKHHWEQMVNAAYFYRGMSLGDLNLKPDVVLDPNQNPHVEFIPLFMEYSEFLLHLIERGFEFQVNDFYVEPLQKVLGWTIRDIKNPGVDFTTNYADAASYAFNYAGSQIKHNFNLITNTIYECENQACFTEKEREKFHEMTKQIKQLIQTEESINHQPVVIKVKRSCASFQQEELNELNVGSYDYFFERVKSEAINSGSFIIEKIAFFLHQKSQTGNFNIRLIKPLYRKDVEEVIEL